MVSFRFHLVSLVAIFLALALGIGMGATVIDKATVESLKRHVATVRESENATNQRNAQLTTQVTRDGAFESRVNEYVTADALKNQRVILIGIKGADNGIVSELERSLSAAGANIPGMLLFTPKATISDTQSAEAMRASLGLTSTDAGVLRQAFFNRVGTVISGSAPTTALQALATDGFIEWDAQDEQRIDVAPFADSLFVYVAGETSQQVVDAMTFPFLRTIAVQPTKRFVAVQPGRDADASRAIAGLRSTVLDVMRNDGATKGAISTVDNPEMSQGRVAMVLALAQLRSNRIGHFGVASTAEGPIPKARA